MKKSFSALAVIALALAQASAADKVKVVSFSSILTEIAQEVGGDAVTVTGLVGPGVDPHDYQPTPGDLKRLSGAKLILASGRHLENYLDKLQASAGGDALLVKVGDQLPSLKMAEEGDPKSVVEDPHWWNSVANVEQAVRVVRDAFIEVEPAAKAEFKKNAASHLARLAALDKWIKQEVALLPRDRRELVTSHDAFQYFARDYGFRIYAIEGIRTEQEASTREVNELIDTIKKQNVKAIFLEDTLNPKVSTEIVKETGAKVGGTLYADGLGAGADTYEKMQKHNVTIIVEALK
ncbi:MAG: metal ABC transporter substrate-binding protein [Terrimicrobiaceae bacterium]|nr:metal ABC transporter substrate-binding protein [Terrimicrobiaceae bacterium]